MSSNLSNSTASKSRLGSFDPSVILLPIFIGFLRTAPFAVPFAMFLGAEFGLTNNHPAPNVWALAPIGAIAFWSVRWLPKLLKDQRVFNIALVLIGIGCWIIWMALEPQWHVGDVLRDPISMAAGRGQFGWIFVVTIVYWFMTLRMAMDEREQSSEGVRGIMVRSLAIVLGGVLLAGIVGDDIGDAGLSAGYIALPIALVSGIGAVGLSEMATTRATARRRGTTVPGWNRWGRTFVGTAAIILVITFVAALVFGPGFLGLVIDTLRTAWQGIATVLLWIIYGLVYVIFYIIRGIMWLFNLLFDTSMEPMEMPQMPGAVEPEAAEPIEQAEPGPWKYAGLARFGGIVALVIIGLLILSRFVKFRNTDADANADEERSSVFSGSLLKNQLRNLFKRRSQAERPRKLDLASDPETVRDSMVYLQVLAERLGIGRIAHETPHDFTNRLALDWPSLADPLAEINRRYERARYGETEEDRNAVVAAWQQVWADRKVIPGATGGD